jgi:hypothetical protein
MDYFEIVRRYIFVPGFKKLVLFGQSYLRIVCTQIPIYSNYGMYKLFFYFGVFGQKKSGNPELLWRCSRLTRNR